MAIVGRAGLKSSSLQKMQAGAARAAAVVVLSPLRRFGLVAIVGSGRRRLPSARGLSAGASQRGVRGAFATRVWDVPCSSAWPVRGELESPMQNAARRTRTASRMICGGDTASGFLARLLARFPAGFQAGRLAGSLAAFPAPSLRAQPRRSLSVRVTVAKDMEFSWP
jgi:hypothetical protein